MEDRNGFNLCRLVIAVLCCICVVAAIAAPVAADTVPPDKTPDKTTEREGEHGAPEPLFLFNPYAKPPAIPSGPESTKVTFWVRAWGTSKPPEFLCLDEVDAQGKPLSAKCDVKLLDNGRMADERAGDYVYTGTGDIPSELDAEKYYRVRAKHLDKTVTSGVTTFGVTSFPLMWRPSDPKTLVKDPDSEFRLFANEVVVRVLPGVSSNPDRIQRIADAVEGTVVGVIPSVRKYLLEIPGDHKTAAGVKAAIARLKTVEGVERAHPNHEAVLYALPTEWTTGSTTTESQSQWYVKHDGIDHVGIYEAWEIAGGGSNVTVAEIDQSRIYGAHDDIQCVAKYPDDACTPPAGSEHGTWVAGVLAARGNNGGIAGVAWDATLHSYAPASTAYEEWVLSNLWAPDTTPDEDRIINLSMAFPNYTQPIIEQTICTGRALFVVAAGQETMLGTCDGALPAPAAFNSFTTDISSCPDYTLAGGILVVGATDINNDLAEWDGNIVDGSFDTCSTSSTCNVCSNRNQWIDIYAPGKNIYTTGTASTNNYIYKSGTSMATPIVSGAAAIVWSLPHTPPHPPWTPQQVHDRLVNRATALCPNVTDCSGYWLSPSHVWGFSAFNQFTIPGDERVTYRIGRRVRATVSGGTVYEGTITDSVLSAVTDETTVTVALDSGSLDDGLSDVDVELIYWLSPSHVWGFSAFNQFTIPGDERVTYRIGRGVRAIVSAGTVFGTISNSSFNAVTNQTTVTVALDSGSLDDGLSDVDVGLVAITSDARVNGKLLLNVFAALGAPTDLTLNPSRPFVRENCINNEWVATVTANDPDAGETFTYSFVDSSGPFSIDSNTGEITVTSCTLDSAASPSYDVTIRVVDSTGLSYEKTFTIHVPELESLCWPPHRGAPGAGTWNVAPTIDGLVQDDVGWRGAHRVTYGDGTDPVNLAFQGLKDNSADYLYLSFEVKNDPTFNIEDLIIINFRPNVNGTMTDDRQIIIQPFSLAGDTGGGCVLVDTNDFYNCSPESFQVLRRNGTTGLFTDNITTSLFNLDVKVRHHPDGTSKAWYVELKVPTSTTGTDSGGTDWIDFNDDFLFYFNVMRVDTSAPGDPTAVQFRWPRSAPIVSGYPTVSIEDYAFSAGEWGLGNKSNTATCNGVWLTPADIGTTNPQASQINLTSNNRFIANVRNSTEVNGVLQAVYDVRVTFRIADWGLPSPDEWNNIRATNPGCEASVTDKDISNNPTCTKDFVDTSEAPVTMKEFNLDWTLNLTESGYYSDNDHQCILVEIDSLSGANIITKSVHRNMDFVPGSRFERTATIGTKGYGPPPPGRSHHEFDLRVTAEELPGKVYEKGTANLREGEEVSRFRWVVNGYRRTGEFVNIGEKRFRIVDPIGSFGYIVSHKGSAPVQEWKQELLGAKKVGDNLYRISIRPGEVAKVTTQIVPEEQTKWWWLWILLLIILILLVVMLVIRAVKSS